mmetsp:Transcript_127978/g.255569  ORF Transcript_127978/g.255569 Transcript_127978/m.255569 type:complete len:84 (+) Transcript_127978:245-496(+)
MTWIKERRFKKQKMRWLHLDDHLPVKVCRPTTAYCQNAKWQRSQEFGVCGGIDLLGGYDSMWLVPLHFFSKATSGNTAAFFWL